jgi:predicted DNA-binding WGR domain protein
MPRYEFVEGASSKFWEIELHGKSFTTTYGKIGADGQSTTKEWKDEAQARKEYDKLVAEKTKKGYTLAGGAPAAPAKKDASSSSSPALAALPAAAPGAQRFELVEGTSSKFWEIKLEGASFTTTYGKLGTAGTSTSKSFADEATAKKEHDKLVAEKTKKGYLPAGGGGGAGGGGAPTKAGTAFRLSDLEQLDGRPHDRAETFMGQKIVDFDPEDDETALKDPARKAWRLMVEAGDGTLDELLEKLQAFVDHPNAGKVKALVIGPWDENVAEAVGDDSGPMKIMQALAAAKGKLGSLAAIFCNEVHSEEAEVSWQFWGPVKPLLDAFPRLEHIRVRGRSNASGLSSDTLRSLQLEGSTMGGVLQELADAKLPALEHLEVWLEDYNGDGQDLDGLVPLVSGKMFPKLRYLGLRDSGQADEVAAIVASSPLIERLRVLDLSLGTLGDEGAEALIASPAVAKLETLDVRHHYISAPVLKRLKALKPVKVRESAAEDGDGDERYVAVGE